MNENALVCVKVAMSHDMRFRIDIKSGHVDMELFCQFRKYLLQYIIYFSLKHILPLLVFQVDILKCRLQCKVPLQIILYVSKIM
jgi:hypothetical protein